MKENYLCKGFLKVLRIENLEKGKFFHLLFLIYSLIIPNFYLNVVNVSTKIIC